MALNNIKVLELAGLAPAPFCGMLLADFGASVIRIDKVNGSAEMDPLTNGKKSIALNLKHKEGIDILRKLSKNADVLIEPFRPGVMESLGIGPNVLLEDNPRLIYARLTGFGQSGYYAKRDGHDINYIAVSGLLSLFGRHGSKPTFPVNAIGDFAGGGLMCAFGILLALLERNSSGLGQVVDCHMTGGSAYLGSWLYRSQNLPIWGNSRGKNILDTGSHFYEVYETKDGKYMAVGAIEPQFYDHLIKGLGLDQKTASQFSDFDTTKKLFTETFLKKTQEEWCKVFDQVDACVTPVLTLNEAVKHQHNLDQDTFVEVNGNIAPKPAPRLSRTPGKTQFVKASPKQAEHTIEILKSIGYSNKDILKLEDGGIIQIYHHPLAKL